MPPLGHRRSHVRTLWGTLALVVAVWLGGASVPAPLAAAQYDLSFSSNSTWTADPTAARVHVDSTVTATSHAVDDSSRRTFYDRIQLALPPDSADFVAISGGNQLPVTVESVATSGVTVIVGLGQRLYSGQSGTFDLRFDLVDTGGSTDRDLRLGHNLMSFPVTAFGSPNTPGSSVSVVFPPDFTVQEEFGGLTRAVYGSGEVVFSSGPIDDPTQLSAWFTAVAPVPAGDYRLRFVTIGPLNVALRYWSDDSGWADQLERVLRVGYPIMRDMIGLGDPTATSLTVEEASSQEIGGFSGSYDQSSGKILISYFADPYVIMHEVAHLWFNGTLVSDRWVQEGFASYYAQQTVDRLAMTDHAPVLTARMRLAAVPLNDWSIAEPDSTTEAYLYGAALEVAGRIATEAGQAGLRDVWAVIRSGQAAYQPIYAAVPEMLGSGSADWRRVLDVLEQTTGLSYLEIWRQWVVDASQVSLLEQRSTALTAYAAAQKAAGAWDLPPEIRRSLDGWLYGQAMVYMVQARDILSQRDEIAGAAADEGTTPPTTLRDVFEQSGLVAARTEATNEAAVLAEMAAARQAETASGGAARDLGLLGANPQADLVAARAAFAKGDTSRAMTLASGARAAWQSAIGMGQARIFGSLCILAGALILLALYIWNRGAFRRENAAVAAAELIARTAAWARSQSALRSRSAGVRAPPVVPEPSLVGRVRRQVEPSGVALADGLADPDGDDEGSTVADDLPATAAGATSPEESAYELLQRGNALLHDRHNAQAAVVLERAARLERSKGSILEALGRAYFNSGQHARAAETFEALLKVDPSAHYGHFGLGLSFARLGRTQQAKTHLRMAAALDPASATYRRALEKIEATKN